MILHAHVPVHYAGLGYDPNQLSADVLCLESIIPVKQYGSLNYGIYQQIMHKCINNILKKGTELKNAKHTHAKPP